MKLGLLSAYGSPMLGYVVLALLKEGVHVNGIFFDSITWSTKNDAIWEERTSGKMPALPLYHKHFVGIPHFFCETHSNEDFACYIREQNFDVLINAGTPRILKKDILQAPTIGIVNAHPSNIKEMRGCTNVEWALYLKKDIYITAHLMTEEIDYGPIIRMDAVSVMSSDSYVDIRLKVYQQQIITLASACKDLSRGNVLFDINYKISPYFNVIDDDKMQNIIEPHRFNALQR